MKNKSLKFYSLIISIFFWSCISENKLENKNSSVSELLFSERFNIIKNEDGKPIDFVFKIDSSNKKLIEKTEFYKLNLTGYDSIYIGQSNDTIYSYDEGMNYKAIFLILNDSIFQRYNRLGDELRTKLKKYNDSTLTFSFEEIKSESGMDRIIIGVKYPNKTISEMTINRNGRIIDIKIREKTNKK